MEILRTIGDIFLLVIQQTWWIVLPVVLFFVLLDLWESYLKGQAAQRITFVMLEVIIPQAVDKTPQAMEQVFAGLSILPGESSKWKDKYWKGSVSRGATFEVASISGEMHFFIRVPTEYRNMVESFIYAQYPSAEIYIVDDYATRFPKEFTWDEYDMVGAEFKLAKEDPYPIRTYTSFEFKAKEEEQVVDPLANMLDSLSSIKEGEEIWFQVYVTPAGDRWRKEGEALVKKLSSGEEKKISVFEELTDFIKNLFLAPFKTPEFKQKEEKPSESPKMTPGQTEALKAIEQNIAKTGFKTGIRAIYLGRKEIFAPVNLSRIVGSLAQFNTQDLNGFVMNSAAAPKSKLPGSWGRRAITSQKQELYDAYRKRKPPKALFIFNTEELATIYHFPGGGVMAPMLPRVGAKKGEPPRGLPTL